MAQNHSELIQTIFALTSLLFFISTMFYHGMMILYQRRGYSQRNMRRDSENMRRRIEELLRDD